jgi:hypothetical protein
MSGWRTGLAVCSLSLLAAQGAFSALPEAGLVLNRKHDVRGVSWTVFSDSDGQAVARFRVGRVSVENERRGFFRIGVLPIVVIEEVRVHLLTGEARVESLTGFREELTGLARGGRWEVRGFSLESVPGAISIEARTVQFLEDEWRFPGGTRLRLEGEEQTVRGATILLAGDEAGALAWEGESGVRGRRLLAGSLSAVVSQVLE